MAKMHDSGKRRKEFDMGKLIIGLSGKKQSGKNAAANQTIAQYVNGWPDHAHPDWKLIVGEQGQLEWADKAYPRALGALPRMPQYAASLAFADALKEFCIGVLGLTHEQCYGTDAEKDMLTYLMWDGLPISIRQKHTPRPPGGTLPTQWIQGRMTAREVMQVFGTDIMRKWYAPIWVDACIRKAKAYDGPLVLITDVRFPDEVEAVQAIGGKVIRLTRAPHSEQDTHESETALDRITERSPGSFDLVVPDGLTIEGQGKHLRPVIEKWFQEYGLIEGAPASLDDMPDYTRKK